MDVKEHWDWFALRVGDGACRWREMEIDDDVLHALDHIELVQCLVVGADESWGIR